jgi:hypothetical protein
MLTCAARMLTYAAAKRDSPQESRRYDVCRMYADAVPLTAGTSPIWRCRCSRCGGRGLQVLSTTNIAIFEACAAYAAYAYATQQKQHTAYSMSTTNIAIFAAYAAYAAHAAQHTQHARSEGRVGCVCCSRGARMLRMRARGTQVCAQQAQRSATCMLHVCGTYAACMLTYARGAHRPRNLRRDRRPAAD